MADSEELPEGLTHERPQGYSMTPQWVIKAARKEVWLYDWLRARYGGLDETFPGIETLADEFGVSRSTIERTLRALVKVKAIEIKARKHPITGAQTTNLYTTKFYAPANQD